jgi:hypothetical protein
VGVISYRERRERNNRRGVGEGGEEGSVGLDRRSMRWMAKKRGPHVGRGQELTRCQT